VVTPRRKNLPANLPLQTKMVQGGVWGGIVPFLSETAGLNKAFPAQSV